jgi:hypothetical protein
MATLSRTAEKCRKCPNVKNCNNKRLEACALAELPKKTGIAVIPMTNSITPIIIKQGEYGNIHTSLEEVNEKIAKALSVNACYFNKQ